MGENRFGEVRIGVADRVATLTLAAPERRNALTPGFVDDIVAAVGHAESRDDVGALVVAAEGAAFCAGADLGELDGADESVLRRIYAAFLRVRATPLPTVAAVAGPAVGAGLNLALACDLRIAGRSAVFDARFAAIGLHPGGGVSWLLREAAGPSAAAAMLLFDQRVDGTTAARIGLAWACFDDDQALAEAQRLAARAARVPAGLSTLIKSTLADTRGLDHTGSLELELERQVWSTTQPWYRERRAARPRSKG
ncbi:enoyl-CoA hydratase [Acrocarpospora pleiomorpha]|uniref:Enoyl-CoA hydratase n=1 Tax=Acrocarpospora pleiomorpha TaxID=90975 RepID=A0A5M3XEG3_9ACTN|nr:enoyl-CoA hydratase-related protein [Acrocarpospora pleiomorpha]GES17313.1 enoyl-CoA hydratase [Acrocarpospora pleiomorpha]